MTLGDVSSGSWLFNLILRVPTALHVKFLMSHNGIFLAEMSFVLASCWGRSEKISIRNCRSFRRGVLNGGGCRPFFFPCMSHSSGIPLFFL